MVNTIDWNEYEKTRSTEELKTLSAEVRELYKKYKIEGYKDAVDKAIDEVCERSLTIANGGLFNEGLW